MSNQLSLDKEKIVYAEWSKVRNEIEKIRLEKAKGKDGKLPRPSSCVALRSSALTITDPNEEKRN
jgi:hypothetical protein